MVGRTALSGVAGPRRQPPAPRAAAGPTRCSSPCSARAVQGAGPAPSIRQTQPGLDLARTLVDPAAEHAALDALVAPLDAAAWETPTPAEGWAVRDQVAHLAYFDGEARRAITDPDGFSAGLADIAADPQGWMDRTVAAGRAKAPAQLLD